MRCDCGAKMVRRWTKRRPGRLTETAERARPSRDVAAPKGARSAGQPGSIRPPPTRPEREGGDSQGPRSAPADVRPMSWSAGAPWVGSARPSWLGDVSQLTGQHKAGRPAALAERLTAQRLRSRGWLAEGLRLTKIHRRLAAQGVRIPYSSLHRFARRQGGSGRRR
jgi:hypothetical protein